MYVVWIGRKFLNTCLKQKKISRQFFKWGYEEICHFAKGAGHFSP
jgi:hypothetical protein